MRDAEPIVNIEELIAAKQNLKLVTLLSAILKGKRIVFYSGIACMVLAVVVEVCIHPRFTASTEIIPPQLGRGGSAVALLNQLGGGGVDAGSLGSVSSALQSKSQSDTFVTMLQAWPIKDALVKRFNLVSVYHVRNVEVARNHLQTMTTIEASKEGFIRISVTDQEPGRSADLSNGYVDELRNFMRGLALSEASQRRVFYEDQLSKTKADLVKAELSFKEMQQSSRMISLDSQAKTMLQGAAELRSQITAREVELQELRSYSTQSNPQVQIAQTELSALRGQLAQLETKNSGGYAGTGLSSVPGAELEFLRSARELKYQETLYDLMVKQYEIATIDESKQAPVIQVIEPALVPSKKSGPKMLRDIAIAFIAGSCLGLFLLLYRYWRLQLTPKELEHLGELRHAAFRW